MKQIVTFIPVLCVNAFYLSAQQHTITVLFDFNKDEIPDSSMLQLVKFIHTHSVENVYIEAHCDSIGSISYNQVLSAKRA
jgi:Outer membrane protein and related peptidoglycan-associated (lipo)proteins